MAAKHQPDLVMCRKQPGIGKQDRVPIRVCLRRCAVFPPRPSHTPLSHPLPSPAIGRLCERCDGKCVVCDSFVRPATLVRICDECNYGTNAGRCCVCGGAGVADAYYCQECTLLEKDVSWCDRGERAGSGAGEQQPPPPPSLQRLNTLLTQPCILSILLTKRHAQRDGCPRIVNLGQARVDLFFDKKKLGGRAGGGGIA